MDKIRYKKFVALQILGLVFILCGQWPLGMVAFVVAHIMSAKPREEVVEREVVRETIREESRYTEPEEEWKSSYTEPEPEPESRYNPNAGEGLKAWKMNIEDDGPSGYEPNAFVIRGAKGTPMLCDFDDDGNATDTGCEISADGWLGELCSEAGMRGTAVVLVHAVRGETGHLLKGLQVNDIDRNGRPLEVSTMAKDGILLEVAESLREDYVREVSG